MQLKKGDWVIDTTGTKEQLEVDAEKGSWYDTECELWTPQENEWCWFFNHSDQIPVLGKYTKNIQTSQQGVYYNLETYMFCEPFIGTLPTNIK